MRPLLMVLSGLGLFVAVVLAYVYFQQERLVYFPSRKMAADPQQLGWTVQAVRFETEDQRLLAGWYIPAPCEPSPKRRPPVSCVPRGVVLFSHGNAGNISHRLDTIALFRELGLDVFIFDYRGYGTSDGHPTEEGTYRDIAAAWRHLVTGRGISPKRIVLYGESIGGAVSTWLATREQPAAVVLVSTFTSIPDLGEQLYPWLPARWLARIRYDTRARLGAVKAPLLILHSRDDEIIPYTHAGRLLAAANEPKRLVTMIGDHNSGLFRSLELVREELRRFLDEFLPRPLPPRPAVPKTRQPKR
ncbi:MAG: alpha/beta hydrolase [Pseudomonadota bacterium]